MWWVSWSTDGYPIFAHYYTPSDLMTLCSSLFISVFTKRLTISVP